MICEPHQAESWLETVNESWDWMDSMLLEAKEDLAWYYNQHWVLALEFHIRDKVYLDASVIHTTCPSQKLAHRYLRPFTVTWEVSWNTYCLQLPTSMSQLHPVFNIVKLLWAPEDPIPGQKAHPPPPPLGIVDGEEHYIVERVLDSQLMRGQLQFLVKWEGYGYEENSWVPELDIQ